MRDKFVVTPDSFTQEQWCEMYVKVVNEYQNLKNTLKDREEFCDKLEEDRENILIENKKQKEVLDKIKEIITSKDICIDTRKTDGSMDYVDLKQIILELLEEIE